MYIVYYFARYQYFPLLKMQKILLANFAAHSALLVFVVLNVSMFLKLSWDVVDDSCVILCLLFLIFQNSGDIKERFDYLYA